METACFSTALVRSSTLAARFSGVIRRVLLDAFGTVFSPARPVVAQYAEVARSHGIVVGEARVGDSFKRAFKRWIKLHPLYGKHSNPPLEPGDWWRGVIGDTFRSAGVSQHMYDSVEDSLSTALIERFWGPQGYSLHCEFPAFLKALDSLHLPPPAIVSNTDPALFKILDNLGVSTRTLGKTGIEPADIFTTWSLEKEKHEVEFWHDVLERLNANLEGSESLKPEEVLVVGDELVADYETPRQAGFQSLLLRRASAQVAHDNPSYVDEIDGRKVSVHAVEDLMQAISWIEGKNETNS
ncbi:hypothetical protein JCM11491_006173 [Sporobolomyces phaffii]